MSVEELQIRLPYGETVRITYIRKSGYLHVTRKRMQENRRKLTLGIVWLDTTLLLRPKQRIANWEHACGLVNEYTRKGKQHLILIERTVELEIRWFRRWGLLHWGMKGLNCSVQTWSRGSKRGGVLL